MPRHSHASAAHTHAQTHEHPRADRYAQSQPVRHKTRLPRMPRHSHASAPNSDTSSILRSLPVGVQLPSDCDSKAINPYAAPDCDTSSILRSLPVGVQLPSDCDSKAINSYAAPDCDAEASCDGHSKADPHARLLLRHATMGPDLLLRVVAICSAVEKPPWYKYGACCRWSMSRLSKSDLAFDFRCPVSRIIHV